MRLPFAQPFASIGAARRRRSIAVLVDQWRATDACRRGMER
jgi:hypothetical protein